MLLFRKYVSDRCKGDAPATGVDSAVRASAAPDWHTNYQRGKKVLIAIYKALTDAGVEEKKALKQRDAIFDIAMRQGKYDRS